MKQPPDILVLTATRFVLGFMFLWAYFDKLFGLGFSTTPAKAWINGGSPSAGFLKNSVTGPFSDLFHALSGSMAVDLLFMVGLLGIGLALVLGIGIRFASWCGIVMMSLMWLALLPSKTNPIFDDHILYILLFLGLIAAGKKAGAFLGLDAWWSKSAFVKTFPFLR